MDRPTPFFQGLSQSVDCQVVEALGVEEKDEDADLVRLKVKAAPRWDRVAQNMGNFHGFHV